VIPRDRHAMFFATLGVIASSIERSPPRSATCSAPRLLEAEEYLLAGPEGLLGHAAQAQPGADRKPDRPCPLVRSYAMPAMENVALWHERDISHSSVERMIGPDATVTLDFALARLTGVIDKLWSIRSA
jgi:adenylosuccinate lyase